MQQQAQQQQQQLNISNNSIANSKTQYVQNRQLISKSFKHIKKVYTLNKQLKQILSQLIKQQNAYIANLQIRQKIRQQCTQYCIQNNILNETQCQNLLSTYANIKQMSQRQLAILKQINDNDNNKYYTLLIELMQQNIIGLYQVYNDQYKSINMILWIIDIMEHTLYDKIIATEEQKQNKRNKNDKFHTHVTGYKQLYDMHTTENVIKGSLILQDIQIPTKHSQSFKVNVQTQQQQKQMDQQKQYIKLSQIIMKVRTNILKFIDKLSHFMQYLTKYTTIFMQLYEQIKYTPKQLQKQQQKQLIQKNRKIMIKNSKQCIVKLSKILQKLMYPGYQTLSDHDTQIIKSLTYIHPHIFYQNSQLLGMRNKKIQKKNSKQYNYYQQQQDDSSTPYIISFVGYDVTYYNKPCNIYLVKDYLIIIQDISIGNQSVSKSRLGKKKQLTVNTLCIVQIDHTTQIQVLFNKMLYNTCTIYISGGEKSSGVFLEFKGTKLNQEQLKKMTQHMFKCKVQQNGGICDVCKGNVTKKWQNITAFSNLQMLKQIIQFKISYHIFLYKCQALNILATRKRLPMLSLNQNWSQKSVQMKVIKPTQSQQQCENKNKELRFIEQHQIPACNKVYAEILQLQYRFCQQQFLKYYVMRLSVLDYSIFTHNTQINNKQESKTQINYNKISQIILISQKQIFQLQQYVFNVFEKQLLGNKIRDISRDTTNYNMMRLKQFKKKYNIGSLQKQSSVQIQTMFIMDFLNTLFKSKIFKLKPQMIFPKLKISEGLWQILTRQYRQYEKNQFLAQNDYDNRCRCYDCQNQSETPFDSEGVKYWKYYASNILHPHSTLLQNMTSQTKCMPFCFMFARRLQLNWINWLDKKYEQTKQKKAINLKQGQDSQQKITKQVLQTLDKINFIKYFKNSKSFNFNMLSRVVKTRKTKTVNVLLYSLPRIQQYYRALIQLGKEDNLQKNNKDKKKDKNMNKNDDIFADMLDQQFETQVNLGFTQMKINCIYEDTTLRHLKFMIGKQLGISQEYTAQFMENFQIILVSKQAKISQKSVTTMLSKLFFSEKKKVYTKYQVNQIYLLHDFERVFDVLDFIKDLQMPQQYYFSLKKVIKIDEPKMQILKIMDTKVKNTKLFDSFTLMLQLQLSQIWYKLNRQQIFIKQKTTLFITLYISLMMSYLKLKDNKKYQLQIQNTKNIDQKLLIKCGIFDKCLIKQLYQSQMQNICQPTQQQQIKKQKQHRRHQLNNLFQAQCQSKQNINFILCKLLRLVYIQTSWDVLIEPILLFDYQNHTQCNRNDYIFISQEGIILMKNVSLQQQIAQNSLSASVFKSKLKNKKQQKNQIQFQYEDICIQMFRSTITLYNKSVLDLKLQGNQTAYTLFSPKALKIYQLILFYKKFNQCLRFQDLTTTSSQHLKYQSQIKKQSNKKKLQNLQQNCINFIKNNRSITQKISYFASSQLQRQYKGRNTVSIDYNQIGSVR